MTPIRTAGTKIYDEPAPRWRSYACSFGRRTEPWVTPEELARIDAGLTTGTIEVRSVNDSAGTIHQFRELPGNPQPSVTANKENPAL